MTSQLPPNHWKYILWCWKETISLRKSFVSLLWNFSRLTFTAHLLGFVFHPHAYQWLWWDEMMIQLEVVIVLKLKLVTKAWWGLRLFARTHPAQIFHPDTCNFFQTTLPFHEQKTKNLFWLDIVIWGKVFLSYHPYFVNFELISPSFGFPASCVLFLKCLFDCCFS